LDIKQRFCEQNTIRRSRLATIPQRVNEYIFFVYHLWTCFLSIVMFLQVSERFKEWNPRRKDFSKSIFKNSYLWIRNENIQSENKMEIHVMLSSSNETQIYEACSQLLTNNTNNLTTWIKIKEKGMKLIIRRKSQVLYHYKSHSLLKKLLISHIVHDFIHIPYYMLSFKIIQIYHVEVQIMIST